MVEFAKSRGFLGYGVLPGGRNDKDSSHAVLPLAEYDELLRRIAVAEPCWYAVRPWDITGSAWWPTTISEGYKGGYHGRVC